MLDSASRYTHGLPGSSQNIYLEIATQIQRFFEEDLDNYPLEMEGKFLRVEVEISGIEPLQWLAKQSSVAKIYWSDRDRLFTVAGIGELDLVTGNVEINYPDFFHQLRQNLSFRFPHLRYYGGISFSQDSSLDPSWQPFGNYRFVIPRFEIYTEDHHTYFAANFCWSVATKLELQLDILLQELAKLDFAQLPIDRASILPTLPSLIDRLDTPNSTNWQDNINVALATFTSDNLDKIVLARRSTLTFTAPLQPQSVLLSLQPHNPHSYHFCFQINPLTAFIGTSPERLYHRRGKFLKTEAIAGTRHRGASLAVDRELSHDLCNSPKDLHEHQLVVQDLHSILTELCESVETAQQSSILKLNKVQHLYTQCQGILQANLTDADILPKLHPTPAVGGFPRIQALKSIRQLEPFERGWYAAPVGWVGADDAEFAVAIRSGLIDRNRLLLFAGAGIVRGSQAEEEWAEIENKIRHFTDLFDSY